MTQYIFANNVNTTLFSPITSTATTLTLLSATNLPALSAGQIMPLTLNDKATRTVFEIVYVTAISGTALTVIRGQEGTASQNWNAGDYAYSTQTAQTTELAIQSGAYNYAVDTGTTANAYVVSLTPSIPATISDGFPVHMSTTRINTGAATLNGVAIVDMNFNPVLPGAIYGYNNFEYDATTGQWILLNPSSLNNFVSLLSFNAKNGATDNTTAIQNALNSGELGILVPPGVWNFSQLTMPQTVGFSFYGVGPASRLVQKGAGINWPTVVGGNAALYQQFGNMWLDGTAGTGDTINSSYGQFLKFRDLWFNNAPVGYSCLHIDGNSTASVASYDVTAKGIRGYSTTAGKAIVELGIWSSDTAVDDVISNGNFAVSYGILADPGAVSAKISNSHPYNNAVNNVRFAGSNSNSALVNVVADNAGNDAIYVLATNNLRMTNVYAQAIKAGYSGIVFDNSYNCIGSDVSFSAQGTGTTAAAREINGSSGNKIIGGTIDALTNYTTPFSFTGTDSYALHIEGYSNHGSLYALSGVAQTAQAQATTESLGANGINPAVNTAWSVPYVGYMRSAEIAVDNTPAAGQTFTFNVMHNGTQVGTGTISNGQYTVHIALSTAVAVGDSVYIQSVFSATSGSASPRYSINLQS
ncbi:hypothetical protein [Petrachloros mirabilis]